MQVFLKVGVPIGKVDLFQELLEETAFRLTGRRFLFNLILFILQEDGIIKNEINGRDVGVIFDGTTGFGEALVILLQYISDTWTIEQRLVCVQLLAKSVY